MQREELERKFTYVKGVLDSNISSFTEKNLVPFINVKSSEISDLSPPS